MLQHSLHLAYEILPVFLIAVLASSLIDKLIPENFFDKFAKKNQAQSFIGITLAAIIGSLIPICTCGMIPLALKLNQRGLAWRYLIAFLVAGNANSIPAMILTMTLGTKIVILRFITSVVFALLVTFIIGLFVEKDFQLEINYKDDHQHDDCCSKKSFWHMVFIDLKEMIFSFLPWILFAIFIASLMHKYFAGYNLSDFIMANDFVGPLMSSFVAFPFYFCAGADLPISKELIAMSLPIGTVFSFMLASPGINLTSFLVYRKAVGLKSSALFLSFSILASTLIGIAINIINLRFYGA